MQKKISSENITLGMSYLMHHKFYLLNESYACMHFYYYLSSSFYIQTLHTEKLQKRKSTNILWFQIKPNRHFIKSKFSKCISEKENFSSFKTFEKVKLIL